MILKKKSFPLNAAIILLVSLLTILVTSITSCNPEEWDPVDCNECYTNKPSDAEVNVKLTINNMNPSVIIDVYSGRLEEESLILKDTVRSETWSTILPVEEYYTITATYRAATGNFNVTAIDGNFIRLRRVRASCDDPCWIVRGNNFNVKLKY
jgi:hypothetical protein